jgi:hypothetical protein
MKKANVSAISDIIKKNWPAVVLFIALILTPHGLQRIIPNIRSRSGAIIFTYVRIILAFGILSVRMIILAGFLRTAHLYGHRKQRITQLLRTGIHFFLRLLLFVMMYVAAQLALHLVFIRLSNAQFVTSDLREYILLTHFLSVIILTFALMKFLLLVPALIIVRDCTLLDGIKSIKKYKLFGARRLVPLFAAYILCSYLLGPLLPFEGISGVFIRHYAGNIIKDLLLITTGLSAVEFVGGLGMQADNGTEGENFEREVGGQVYSS